MGDGPQLSLPCRGDHQHLLNTGQPKRRIWGGFTREDVPERLSGDFTPKPDPAVRPQVLSSCADAGHPCWSQHPPRLQVLPASPPSTRHAASLCSKLRRTPRPASPPATAPAGAPLSHLATGHTVLLGMCFHCVRAIGLLPWGAKPWGIGRRPLIPHPGALDGHRRKGPRQGGNGGSEASTVPGPPLTHPRVAPLTEARYKGRGAPACKPALVTQATSVCGTAAGNSAHVLRNSIFRATSPSVKGRRSE